MAMGMDGSPFNPLWNSGRTAFCELASHAPVAGGHVGYKFFQVNCDHGQIFSCDENTSGTPRVLIEVLEFFFF